MAGKVLVVDDDASVQRLLQYTLKQEGYEVAHRRERGGRSRAVAAGVAVADPARRHAPGRGRLRGRDHGSAPRRARVSHVPIIMLTSDKDVQQKVRALRAGADDYLIKPFHPAELLARMKSLIARFAPSDTLMGRPPMGRVHAYYGAKGGVGTTTIAINAAIALQGLGRRVVPRRRQPPVRRPPRVPRPRPRPQGHRGRGQRAGDGRGPREVDRPDPRLRRRPAARAAHARVRRPRVGRAHAPDPRDPARACTTT